MQTIQIRLDGRRFERQATGKCKECTFALDNNYPLNDGFKSLGCLMDNRRLDGNCMHGGNYKEVGVPYGE